MSDKETPSTNSDSTVGNVPSIEWIPSAHGVSEIYTNFIHINWTLFDLRLRLGQVVADPRQSTPIASWAIIERAAVTIPWGQAKYLRDQLNECLERYEKVNGPLTVPQLP